MRLSQNEFKDYKRTPVCFKWLWAKWEKHIHCAAALHMNLFFGPNFMRQNHPNTVSPIAAESIITTLELDRIALSQTNKKQRSTRKKYYFSDFSFCFPRAGQCICRKTNSNITKGHLFASIDCELREKNTFTAQRRFTWIVFCVNFMRQTHPNNKFLNAVSPIAAESIITTLELDEIALSQTSKKKEGVREKILFFWFSFFVFQEPANAFVAKRIRRLRRDTCLLQLIVS